MRKSCPIDRNGNQPINDPYYTHYVLVRADLPVGIQAANIIHAAGRSAAGLHCDGTYAVALHVPDEVELRALAYRLAHAGIPRHLIVESDEPYSGQAMALGIEPCDRAEVKRFLSKYPLIKSQEVLLVEHYDRKEVEAAGSRPVLGAILS